jgi:uncharacterized repeat protein (TIGR01451 family)
VASPGSDTFTYTLTVDNGGRRTRRLDATVTDVLPAGVDFVAYGTLPAGVACTLPEGRTLECTIAAPLLQVSSPDVGDPLRRGRAGDDTGWHGHQQGDR